MGRSLCAGVALAAVTLCLFAAFAGFQQWWAGRAVLVFLEPSALWPSGGEFADRAAPEQGAASVAHPQVPAALRAPVEAEVAPPTFGEADVGRGTTWAPPLELAETTWASPLESAETTWAPPLESAETTWAPPLESAETTWAPPLPSAEVTPPLPSATDAPPAQTQRQRQRQRQHQQHQRQRQRQHQHQVTRAAGSRREPGADETATTPGADETTGADESSLPSPGADETATTTPPPSLPPPPLAPLSAPAPKAPAPVAASSATALRPLPRVPDSHWHDAPAGPNHLERLPPAVLEAGLSQCRGNRDGLRRMLLRLARNESVTIALWGGSMPAGHGCTEAADPVTRWRGCEGPGCGVCAGPRCMCSYGLMVARRLQRTFPGAKVSFYNNAEGGYTSSSHVYKMAAVEYARVGQEAPDLVILDHGANDKALPKSHVQASLETSIRLLRCLHPCAQLAVTASVPTEHHVPPEVASWYLEVARHYGLPLVSPVQAEFVAAKEGAKFWDPPNIFHPKWKTHAYIADLFARALNAEEASLERDAAAGAAAECASDVKFDRRSFACEDPFPRFSKEDLLRQYEAYCLDPLSIYVADGLEHSTVRLAQPRIPADRSWTLKDDALKKKGWISEKVTNNPLSFEVRFGPKPRLVVAYLKTYEFVGQADLRLKGMRGGYLLDGRWEDKTSQAYLFHSQADAPFAPGPKGDYARDRPNGLGVEPNSRGVVEITLTKGPKFKLLGVVSC